MVLPNRTVHLARRVLGLRLLISRERPSDVG